MKNEVLTAAEWQAMLAKKDNEIKRLKHTVELLTQQFHLMQARKFAPSSEKTSPAEQLSIFNEAEATAVEGAPETEQIACARKKQKGKRKADFSKLPVERIVHELPDFKRVCPDCGQPMHACGHDVLRREVTCVPARYKVTEHVQTVYSCRNCEKTSDHVPMKKSEVPPPVIPGSGLASPSLLAQIINAKYTLALPLYRQEQEFGRMGLPISRQTMSNWVLAAHERYFAKIFSLLHEELLKNEILHADDD